MASPLSRNERIGWGVVSAAAFAVGILLGSRGVDIGPADADAGGARAMIPRDECPTRTVTKTVQAPPEIIYECPPEPEPEAVRGAQGKAVGDKTLPEPEPDIDPLMRQRLLAWVRDASDDLKTCRDDSKEIYRVAVTMHLEAKTGRVTRVDINANRGEVPRNLPTCLRRRILEWTPPTEFTQGRTKLVFGLTI